MPPYPPVGAKPLPNVEGRVVEVAPAGVGVPFDERAAAAASADGCDENWCLQAPAAAARDKDPTCSQREDELEQGAKVRSTTTRHSPRSACGAC